MYLDKLKRLLQLAETSPEHLVKAQILDDLQWKLSRIDVADQLEFDPKNGRVEIATGTTTSAIC